MFLEFCEIFQNNFLTEKLWVSAFDQSMKFLKLPKMLLHIFFENTVYKKLVMTVFVMTVKFWTIKSALFFYK